MRRHAHTAWFACRRTRRAQWSTFVQTQSDIFIWNFARQTLTPLTFEHADDNPVWTTDGRRVIFQSARSGQGANLYWQFADGTGSAERLTSTRGNQNPKAVTPDGLRVIFTQQNTQTSANDFHTVSLDGKAAVAPLLETPHSKNDPSVSPDGRWLAYQSRETGDEEVYVRPFPGVDSGRWLVSTSGGRQPQWARSGRELFFIDREGFLTSVQVDAAPAFAASAPRRVLETKYAAGSGPWTYDVAKDGKRFLMLKDAHETGTPASPDIVVMLNWLEELTLKGLAQR